MMKQTRIALAAYATSLAVILAACGSSNSSSSNTQATPAPMVSAPGETPAPNSASTEKPVEAESNPPGDIPDTQASVSYTSTSGGYSVDVPEGWARTIHGPDVSFVDKFDGVAVRIHTPPATRASIERLTRAGRDFRSKSVALPGGAALLVTYTSNSNPDPVTGKKIRLENMAAIFVRGAKSATVFLWAPLGSDNVDAWNLIERSFRWR